MIKVLIVSSEAVPFAKTGGLADVTGALPKSLLKKGVDARVVLPFYKTIPTELKSSIICRKNINIKLGWRNQSCTIYENEYDGIMFYFIGNEYYFGKDRLYGYSDDDECFAYFCKAVLEALPHLDFMPDIMHLNDWQTGMIPLLLRDRYKSLEAYRNISTLFTIHNLQYQGICPWELLRDVLELGDQYFTPEKLEFYGSASFIKGGLVYSDLINTVSPTYSIEIQYPYLGEGLDGLLRSRNQDLLGILNGIDYDRYNPGNDPYIPVSYDIVNLDGKKENKLKLQKLLNLDVSENTPVIGLVSRLVSSKGLDLISAVFPDLMDLGLEFVLLGTGEPQYESFFTDTVVKYKGRVSASIMFDDHLAHNIYAGADMFLMPSLFEPCGLGQIIALRYGTIPIVHETGGLMDTIEPYNEFTKQGNGFSFTDYSAQDMLYTIKRAVSFYQDKPAWRNIAQNAMSCDFSWDSSASKYIQLYDMLMKKRN